MMRNPHSRFKARSVHGETSALPAASRFPRWIRCGYDLSELTRADREEKIASVQSAVGSAKNAVKSAEEHVLKLGGCGKVLWAFIILYAFILIAQLGTGFFSGLSKVLSHPLALISVAILIGLFFYLQKKER